jgi:hypothetical protein
MKQLIISLFVLLFVSVAQAQDGSVPADGMRAGGKIYVVLTVALTVLVGLILYVVRLDRKISKLEKQIK